MQEETLLKRRPSHKCTSAGLDVALSAADGWARASDGGAGREKSECVNGSEWRVVVLERVDGGRWTASCVLTRCCGSGSEETNWHELLRVSAAAVAPALKTPIPPLSGQHFRRVARAAVA